MRLDWNIGGLARFESHGVRGAPIADIALLSDFHFLLFGPVDILDLSSVIAA